MPWTGLAGRSPAPISPEPRALTSVSDRIHLVEIRQTRALHSLVPQDPGCTGAGADTDPDPAGCPSVTLGM